MQKIHYVNTLPGMGKTRWAKQEMVRRIRSNAGITLYVAPTIDLLEEVAASMRAKLKAEGLANRIRLHHTKNSDREFNISTLIHYSLYGQDQIVNGVRIKPIEPGSVIMITHESFVRLPLLMDGKPKIRVIFDEARKCLIQPITLRIKGSIEAFMACFMMEPSPDKNYLVISKVSRLRLDKYFVTYQKKDGSQKSAANAIAELVKGEAHELYVKIDHTSMQFTVHGLMLPTQIFRGWKEVYLMSAYLRNSQLWATLQRGVFIHNGKPYTMEKAKPSDNTDEWFVPRLLPDHKRAAAQVELIDCTRIVIKDYDSRRAAIKSRYSKATVVALTENREIHSKRKFQSFLMPSELITETSTGYRKALKEAKALDPTLGYSPQEVHTLYQSVKLGVKTTTPATRILLRWYSSIRKVVQPDSAVWHINTALKLAHKWRVKHGTDTSEQILVSLNNEIKDRVIKNPALMKKILVLPFSPHGMNIYQHIDVVAFFASVQLSNEIASFFKTVMPWYMFNRDYSGDTAIQAVTRSSIRDTDSQNPVLIIVSDPQTANGIASLLGKKPNANGNGYIKGSDYLGYAPLMTLPHAAEADTHSQNRRKKYRAKPQVRQRDKVYQREYQRMYREHTNTSPHYKELARIRVAISKAKHNPSADIDALTKRKDALAALQKQWVLDNPFKREQ